MNRSDVKYFFLTGVVDALIGKGQRAQNQQYNSNQGDRFHFVSSPLLDDSSSALNEPNQNHDDGRHQQDVDETTQSVRSDKSQ
jgi:hypothetical protein